MKIILVITLALFTFPHQLHGKSLEPVDQIHIEGTQRVPESLVRGWIVTRPGVPLDSLPFRNDADRILKRYQEEGFWQTAVSYATSQSKGKPSVLFRIHEGKRTRLDSIEFIGNSKISTAELKGRMKSTKGTPVQRSVLDLDLESLLTLYENRGYPYCSLSPDLSIVPGQDDTKLKVTIDEGPFVQVDTILFRGVQVTRTAVLQREMRMVVGKPYSQGRVDEAMEGLRRLPFLLSVDGSEIEPSGKGTALVVWVREANGTRLEAGIGYAPGQGGTSHGLTGAFSLAFENLLGTGRSGEATWSRKGRSSSDLRLSYQEPWLFGQPLSAGIRMGIQQRPGYTEDLFGSDLTWNYSQKSSISLGLTRSGVQPDSMGIGEFLSSHTWAIEGSILYDSRDNRWNPRTGSRLHSKVVLGRVDRGGGGNSIHRNYRIDVDQYWPTGSRSLIAVGVHGGQVQQGKEPPTEVRLKLGGIETIRGFREETFQATRALWTNLEWRRLLGIRSRVFLFLDIGYLQDPLGEKKTQSYPVGYGAGLRMASQLGMIGLDYGLAKGESPGQGKVHLQMVNEF